MVVPVAGRLGGPRVERGTRRGEPGAERAEIGDPVGGEFAGQPDDALLDDRLRRGGERAARADQQRVAVVQHEERGLGKNVGEPAHHRLEVLFRQVVEVDPLAEEAALGEPGADQFEELDGEQRRNPAHPRIRGLRDHHVVRAAVEEEVIPRVHFQKGEAFVLPGRPVARLEETGGHRHLG